MKFEIKTAEQLAEEVKAATNSQRIAELKRLLSESDYKVAPDYDRPDEGILQQRQAWREEIRALSR